MHVETLKYNAITGTPPRKGDIYERSPDFWKPSDRLCLNSLNVQCTTSLPYPIPTGAATATRSWAVHLPPRSPPGKKSTLATSCTPPSSKKSTTSPLAKNVGKETELRNGFRLDKWKRGFDGRCIAAGSHGQGMPQRRRPSWYGGLLMIFMVSLFFYGD